MGPEDAEAVARLSGQLGYPATAAQIQERLARITRSPDNGFFVAERSGTVLGWVHVYGVHPLMSPSYAEVGGLVVAADARRQGIGRALMGEAEGWAQRQQYPDLRLRSGLHRADAHAFYQSIGYELTKTSHMFRKAFPAATQSA